MPQIKTYEAGNLALRPTETGIEATAAAGRRLGAFYNQVGGAFSNLGREQEQLGRETGQLGRETGQLYGRLGQETSELGTAKGRALVAWGRGLGSGIEAGGTAALKWQEHREISQGALTIANLSLAKTQEWNDTVKNADPNNPNVAADFRGRLETDLEKVRGSFITEKGQQWAEAHIDTLRNHFFHKTASDMSSRAGRAVADSHRQTVNALSATVYNDPSALDFALSNSEGAIEGKVATSPNLTGEDAVKVRSDLKQKDAESIIKAAVLGHIDKTGEVPDWVNNPKYSKYINAVELRQFGKAAQTQQRADRAQQKALDTYNRQQAKDQAEGQVNKAFTDNVTIDEATGRPIIKPGFFKDVLDVVKNNPDAPNATTLGRTYLNWGEAQLRQRGSPVQSDPGVKQQLVDRIMDPDNPTTSVDLMQAQINDKLSNQDFTKMHRMVTELEKAPLRDPVFKATMQGAKGLLGTDPIGQEKYADFVQDFLPRYQAGKRAGTLESNALDLKNPDSMIRKAMAPYQRDAATIMRDRILRGEMQGVSPTLDVGMVRNGWRYKGGDPSKPDNWEREQTAPRVPVSQ